MFLYVWAHFLSESERFQGCASNVMAAIAGNIRASKILLARVLTLSSAAFFRPTYTSGVLRTRKPVH